MYISVHTHTHKSVKEVKPFGLTILPTRVRLIKTPGPGRSKALLNGWLGKSSDSQNNIDYQYSPLLPFWGWKWAPIAENATHLGRRTLVIQAGSDLKASMVSENIVPAAEGGKQLTALWSCNTCELQQLPPWQDMHKGTISDAHMSVASNDFLVGLKVLLARGKFCLILET